MTSNSRFIKSVLTAAKSDVPAMPWARGAHRKAFIARRSGAEVLKKTA
ncbi:hypothetical protein [Shimia biformata]|nr:hypothetical protein [Shimia biformata]